VANGRVTADPLQVTLLTAVAPIGAKVSVLSIKDCVDYCKSPEGEKENIFVIAKFPENGLAVVEGSLDMRTTCRADRYRLPLR